MTYSGDIDSKFRDHSAIPKLFFKDKNICKGLIMSNKIQTKSQNLN